MQLRNLLEVAKAARADWCKDLMARGCAERFAHLWIYALLGSDAACLRAPADFDAAQGCDFNMLRALDRCSQGYKETLKKSNKESRRMQGSDEEKAERCRQNAADLQMNSPWCRTVQCESFRSSSELKAAYEQAATSSALLLTGPSPPTTTTTTAVATAATTAVTATARKIVSRVDRRRSPLT